MWVAWVAWALASLAAPQEGKTALLRLAKELQAFRATARWCGPLCVCVCACVLEPAGPRYRIQGPCPPLPGLLIQWNCPVSLSYHVQRSKPLMALIIGPVKGS